MQKAIGFTLIEVLIASVILFTVLTITALTFSNARDSSERAENVIRALAPIPNIVDTIRFQIRANPQDSLAGDGHYQQVSYRWQAEAVEYKAPPQNLNVETMESLSFHPRFYLYDVNLTVSYEQRAHTFTFRELAWVRAEPKYD